MDPQQNLSHPPEPPRDFRLGKTLVRNLPDPRGPNGPDPRGGPPDSREYLLALLPCCFCGRVIGYGRDFYAVDAETPHPTVAHRTCLEEDAHTRSKGPPTVAVKASIGIGKDGVLDPAKVPQAKVAGLPPLGALVKVPVTHQVLCQMTAHDLDMIVGVIQRVRAQVLEGDVDAAEEFFMSDIMAIRENAVLRLMVRHEAKDAGISLDAFLERRAGDPDDFPEVQTNIDPTDSNP